MTDNRNTHESNTIADLVNLVWCVRWARIRWSEWGGGLADAAQLIIIVTYLLASHTVKFSFSPSLRSPIHLNILYETEYVFVYAYKTNPTTQPSYLKPVT